MARSNPPASVKGCSQKSPVVSAAPNLFDTVVRLARARSLPAMCHRTRAAPNLVVAGVTSPLCGAITLQRGIYDELDRLHSVCARLQRSRKADRKR